MYWGFLSPPSAVGVLDVGLFCPVGNAGPAAGTLQDASGLLPWLTDSLIDWLFSDAVSTATVIVHSAEKDKQMGMNDA
jgi:hypothetical protein